MPIFEYKCEKCGYKFEELTVKKEDTADVTDCKNCGGKAKRQFSSFSHTVKGGSFNESVDMSIGREANNRWQSYYDKQSKRHGDKKPEPVELPKTKDGKYMPIMGLGDKKEVKDRSEYVSALQDHRKQRQEKGLGQFTDKGSF
jgi:putative FmdB family regulatory protein